MLFRTEQLLETHLSFMMLIKTRHVDVQLHNSAKTWEKKCLMKNSMKKKREKKTIFSYLWLSYSVRKVRRNFFLNFEAVFLYELHSILPLGCIDHDIYNWTMTFKHNMYSLTLYLTFFRENDRKKDC